MEVLCFTVNQMLLYTVVMLCTGFAITIMAIAAMINFVSNMSKKAKKEEAK